MIPESHPFSNFLLSLQALFDGVLGFGESVLSPGWRQNQILILLALVALAWILHRVTGVMLQNWVRSREGWSKWQLRVVVQVKRRLGLIWFALLAGILAVRTQHQHHRAPCHPLHTHAHAAMRTNSLL